MLYSVCQLKLCSFGRQTVNLFATLIQMKNFNLKISLYLHFLRTEAWWDCNWKMCTSIAMAGDVGGVSLQDKRSLNVCLEPLRSACLCRLCVISKCQESVPVWIWRHVSYHAWKHQWAGTCQPHCPTSQLGPQHGRAEESRYPTHCERHKSKRSLQALQIAWILSSCSFHGTS